MFFEVEVTEEYEIVSALNLNGKDCYYDTPSNTLKYSLSKDNLLNFSPKTVFQDYSEVKLNGKLLHNNTINDFGNIVLNTPYDLEIKTLGETRTINLVFTDIPLVQIIAFDEITNEPKVLAKIIVNYPNISTSSVESHMGIEIRGKSTAGLDKKSYNFKPLDSENMEDQISISFFDMTKNYKWSLDAMFVDKSKTRNKTSFEIWNNLSNQSIKSQYVEVFLNNKSLGLYRFSENYTQELLNLSNSSSLYVGNDNSDVTKFETLPKKEPKSAYWGEWKQEFPYPSEKIYWNDFYKFDRLVVEANDQSFSSEIGNLIDLDNVIDYYLFINLCNGYDNVGKNWFFVKQNSTSKFKILIWDLDATWGRDAANYATNTNEIISNRLFDRLITLNPDEFKQKLKARWGLLRTNQFREENILNQFDLNIEEVLKYNIEETENQIWNTNVNILDEQKYINSWVNKRLLFLDDYFNNL